jgi:hypothetical protein
MKTSGCVAMLLVCFALCSCRTRPSIGRGEIFWTDKDIEGFKLPEDTELRTIETTLKTQPKFYAGRMPLKATLYVEDITQMGGIIVMEEYPGFTTLYIYNDKLHGTAIGAITLSNSADLIAQAKVIRSIPDGFEIEEQHYDGCDGEPDSCPVVFQANSKISWTGFKTEESKVKGQKNEDYYFLWPTHLQ